MTDLHCLDPNPSGKPAVLLLHGLGADGSSWMLQFPALSQAGYRPLAPDSPGFGASPYDGRGWSIRRAAAQMAELLEQLGTGPAHLVGLSMGGVIAQQFSLDYPQLTRRLVLVSTFSVLRPQNLNGWVYFIRRAVTVLTLGLNAQAQVVARRVFPDPKDSQLRDLYIGFVSHADPRAYRLAMLSLGLFDSRKRLANIKAHTLVITGADDTTVSPARQRILAEAIPFARQMVVQQAGHAVCIDQSEQFNQVLLGFLKE
jgi:3-oxoadipate enol-lactonase